ncbi:MULTISPECIES: glycosyltransferase family 2 protein [unclassified Bradyrhizobium]|uniref:glycosyltransferase family 2 protein n=1 Tax=unclassified Bradyrhizobium TaxID=2631580 RepID=UPI002FF1277C
MTEAKLVSVVVPTRDRPELLREALQSIRALESDGVRFEIIVGDNGTSSDTQKVAEAFDAIYLHTSTFGAAAARNIAMRAATADYIAFLDDDDVWTSNHIHGHLALLAANPRLDMVFGQIINTDPERRPIYGPWPEQLPDERRDLLKFMLNGYFPQIGATVVRARVRETVGFFDESFIGGQDWDWQLRIARQHGVGFVRQPCVLFSQRETGTYDSLQLRRAKFTRRIFLRNAIPEWRVWASPIAFARSYFEVTDHYFFYFAETALDHANKGERWLAICAIWRAFTMFPSRALRKLLSDSSLREALMMTLRSARAGRSSG